MQKGSFAGRRNELEEKFFAKRDKELLAALREKRATRERKKALAEASGIHDDDVLDQLDQLDVSGETLAALSLVPPIAVAWADGTIDAKERRAVMAAAEQEGMEKGHAGYLLLEGWLEQKPDATLLEAWKNYVIAFLPKLPEPARNALKESILGRARSVAKATGGLLGLGNKVSKAEQAVLTELEQVFA